MFINSKRPEKKEEEKKKKRLSTTPAIEELNIVAIKRSEQEGETKTSWLGDRLLPLEY